MPSTRDAKKIHFSQPTGGARPNLRITHSSWPATDFPTWLVSHGQDSGFVAWRAEWIFALFDARTLRFEPALRTRAYAPERLLSLHVMDTWTGQTTEIPRAISIDFDVTVHDVDMMSARDLSACNPLLRQLHPKSKFVV